MKTIRKESSISQWIKIMVIAGAVVGAVITSHRATFCQFLLALTAYELIYCITIHYYLHDAVPERHRQLSPYVLAQLAGGAYLSLDKALPVIGWKRLHRHIQRSTGGSIEGACVDVYENKKLQKLVLAVRGTDASFIGDVAADAGLFRDRLQKFVDGSDRHKLPEYSTFVLTAMKACEAKFPNYQHYLTGHSLGAACCEAAWTADVGLKSEAAATRTADDIDSYCLDPSNIWRCVTWESPGFALNTELKNVIRTHEVLLDTHVVHYLGAPNPINCLHEHISKNRRYRTFLDHDNRLTCWHFIGCLWRDVVVVMNWVSLVGGALRLGATYYKDVAQKAAQAAEVARGRRPPSPNHLLQFIAYHWKILTCATSGNEEAAANLLAKAHNLEDYQVLLTKWFTDIMPLGDHLDWSVVQRSSFLQGTKAVEFVLHQHSLKNHIDSFDVSSGHPIRWVQIESWPCLAEVSGSSMWEGLRSSFIPNNLTEHFDPAVEVENRICRLSGYKQGRIRSAGRKVLEDQYDYLGPAFFDKIFPGYLGVGKLQVAEECCREEYRRFQVELPVPLYVVG